MERLKVMAELVKPDMPAADIGADHALLSRYLVENRIVPQVIVIELGDQPYRRACAAVSQSCFSHRIEVRQGDGLQPLRPGEVTNVIIAGMGGDTMVRILACDWGKSASYERFVLQPMSRPAVLRGILASRGWPILEERLVQEKGHFHTILAVSPGDQPYQLSSLEQDLGPCLLQMNGPLQRRYLQQAHERYVRIRDHLLNSQQPPRQVVRDIQEKLAQLEVRLK